VSDTGIGIAPELHDRLFQRFSQVDGSTGREFGGTGLGLAISKRLIELMAGEIGFENAPGKGSTFWFTVALPAAQAPALVARRPADSPHLQALRILLVEDIEVNQEIACAMLTGAGHQVDVAADGTTAIASVKSRFYDVVLMDIQMSGIDGVTATRRIRALPGPAAQVPIIAMTANVLPQQVQAFRDAGMNGHVGKPLRRNDLLAAIDRCVSGAASATIVAPSSPLVIDEEILAETVEVFGRDRANELLGRLAAQLARQFAHTPTNAEEWAQLASEAHKLISTSGLFGLTALSARCLELEVAIKRNAYSDELLDKVRAESREAATTIAGRLAGTATSRNPSAASGAG
jgi:CheY-like chemotaxis protein/HPt (histidine-containing phosphotransfer) domain-containing protein